MDVDTGVEVLEALARIPTGKLEVVLRVVASYSTTPLMISLAAAIRGELASRKGWNGRPEFTLPFLKPWELRVGAHEALGVSEFVDNETAGLFTAIAHALASEAEIFEKIAPDGPPN